MSLKPIETIYNGYKFRSRLEARWAVFFDTLGIDYEYEPEGYEIDGDKYLPDFYLPKLECFAEVKGHNEHLQEDIEKVESLVKIAKKSAIILSTIPYSKEAKGLYFFPEIYYISRISRNIEYCYILFQKYKDNEVVAVDDIGLAQVRWRNGTFRYGNMPRNERLWGAIQPVCGEILDVDHNDEYYGIPLYRDACLEGLSPIQEAIEKARQARFEYGEKGKP